MTTENKAEKQKGDAPVLKGFFYRQGEEKAQKLDLWARDDGKTGLKGNFGSQRVAAFPPAGQTTQDGENYSEKAPLKISYKAEGSDDFTELEFFPRVEKNDGAPVEKPFLSGKIGDEDIVINIIKGHALVNLPVPAEPVEEATQEAEQAAPAAAAPMV